MVERHNLATRTSYEENSVDQTTEELRQNIAARRESITETVDKISDRVHRTLDWREYISDYPIASLGIAFGLGVVVSGIFKPRPTPSERILEALSETIEDVTDRVRGQFDAVGLNHSKPSSPLLVLATSWVAKAAVSYLGNQLTSNMTNHNEERVTASHGGDGIGRSTSGIA
ncbi:MAG: DUF3618 domain-containing protein [Acidobacteria bacterium]|nr:DUF3618 domain-containing protein [Acidobacteriota bacterium]